MYRCIDIKSTLESGLFASSTSGAGFSVAVLAPLVEHIV